MPDRVPLDVRRRLPTRIRYMFDAGEGEDPCWLWEGQIDSDGYGRCGGRMAHRRLYEELVGSVAEGCDLDHRPTCSRRCVRPEHLTPTPREVNRRWIEPPPKPKGQLALGLTPVEPPRTRRRWD